MTATYAQIAEIQSRFALQEWIYAKTMPRNPHHYALRKNWGDDADFEATVRFIREYGHDDPFGGKIYRAFDLNGFHYWTMGAPLGETILINRKEIRRASEYDALASAYDGWWSDPEGQRATDEVLQRLDYRGGSVLDVGSGTGLLLDNGCPANYVGLDPSQGMIERLLQKHPTAWVLPWNFEEFAGAPQVGQKFDLVVSLFGAASYIDPPALARVPQMLTPRGRFFWMFYAPDYVPRTDFLSGRFLKHFGAAWRNFLPSRVTRWGDYEIAEGGATVGA